MSIIFSTAARNIRLMCNVTRIQLDAPVFKEQYVSFPLMESHGINADFYIRPQGVGLTCKGDDLLLFYLLQNRILQKSIQFHFPFNGKPTAFEPCISGDGENSVKNPLKFYLGTIASGNLKNRCDIVLNRDESTHAQRGDFLSDVLFTQWIAQMMPYIESYRLFKENDLLRELNSNFDPEAPHKGDGGLVGCSQL